MLEFADIARPGVFAHAFEEFGRKTMYHLGILVGIE
jgi:hypothetical protein